MGAKRSNWLFAIWKTLVALVTIYVAICVPLEFAFPAYSFGQGISNWIVVFVFASDFILNASYLKKFRKEEASWAIESKSWYRKMLLLFDLLAAIPFELFFPIPTLKLFRLFKLPRLYHAVNVIQQSLLRFAGTFLFVSFAFWSVLVINALACGWNSQGIKSTTSDFATDYINAAYWTVTTLTTVGYGDIIPVTNAQKIYAIFVQIMGFGVFTFMIGTVASRLMQKDPARKRYEENMESLSGLLHYKTLPFSLRSRIVNFYKYMWRQRLGYDETAFLQTLPDNLQTEVALHLKKNVIEKVSLFKDSTEQFKREIALLLKPIFLTPGDYIFKAGDIGNEMYFVVEGELETLTGKEDRVITMLKSGDFFGEISLFKNQNRSATIKATDYCDIYSLDKESFDKVIARFPEIVNEIRLTCEQREQKYSV